MGHGLAKVLMLLCAAALIACAGWRGTWVVLGLLTLTLVVGPSLLFMRRSREVMGLLPDGKVAAENDSGEATADGKNKQINRAATDDVEWTRREICTSFPSSAIRAIRSQSQRS